MKFQTLVNKVAREMDADSDYNEAVALAKELGATDEVAAKVAKELGRRPSNIGLDEFDRYIAGDRR